VVITGGAQGIGKCCADCFEREGAIVHVIDKRQGPWFVGDLADKGTLECFAADVLAKSGRVDLLVNNAGVAPLERRDLLEMTEESFDRVLRINLKGTMFMCQLFAREMIAEREYAENWQPRIVNIGSMSAYTSSISRGEYCISKAGVGMVTKLFADRLAAEGIPVFEVRPGIIDTGMTKVVHEKYQRLIEGGLLPVKRFGTPLDVAKMVLACAEGLLDYSAGQVLDADGGFSLQRL
jgi:NAD(P)-dependent dehydrogenase (short-subunit alcohol dehydrogenase family)